MSNDLKDKIEFVEKMKRENPRAFQFLARDATILLANLENDLIEELSDWYVRANRVCGKQKTLIMLRALLEKED